MSISTAYVPAFSLNTIFTNKDTAEALSGGIVTFYKDSDEVTGKPVYQLTEVGQDYLFTTMGSVLTLSSTGTFVDSLGNPVVPYFYPYDANGALDLYFVTVYSADAVLQFTRSAVPYVSSGGTASTTYNADNQISNPQFVEVLFEDNGPTTYSVTGSNTVTAVAPDWDIITSGTATVIVERLNNLDTSITSSPPYALQFTTSGLTADLQVRQRISNSPRLFANEYVSSNIEVSVTSATDITFVLNYTPSTGTSHELINETVSAGVGFTRFANSTLINGTINTDTADAGYVDIIAVIPANSEVSITSVQIAGTSSDTSILPFSEEATPRQIDQLYHYAYPIVPVGAIIDFGGFSAPAHYLFCDGTAYNRVAYEQLFRATSNSEDVSLTSTVNTFDVADGSIYYIGMSVEGTGIPSSTTITGIATNTITISNAATATQTSTVTFFAWGNGDGSTTFNVPDLQGYVTSGADGSVFSSGLNAVGYKGGSSTHTIAVGEIPDHTHNVSSGAASGSGAASRLSTGTGASLTGGVTGVSNTAMTIVQQTANVRKYIRYQ